MIQRAGRCSLAVALAAGALLAGCGGDDEPDPKQEFITTADEICALGTFEIGNQARNRYGQPAPPPRESEEFSKEVVVPTLQSQVLERLRRLTPPAGDEQELAALYDALERGIDTLRQNPELLDEPGTGGAFDEANRLAQAYGFKQCGQG